MPEGTPINKEAVDGEPITERLITPSLIAIGRIYGRRPIPIPTEYVPQLQELVDGLFDGINIGDRRDPGSNSRNQQIARRYYDFDGDPKVILRILSKDFNLTRERIRQIKDRAGRIFKSAAMRKEEFSEIPHFLPFGEGEIGYSIFGGDIIGKEIRDGLPQDLTVADLNLSGDALRNLESNSHSKAIDKYHPFALLSRSSFLVTPETMEELTKSLEKLGLRRKLPQD